jgi:transposase-like protein
MKNQKKNKQYNRSFKEQAVKLANERGNTSEVARELGVSDRNLHRWRRELEEFKGASFQGKGVSRLTPEQAEIQRLNKLLEIQRKENEILKKAIGIISLNDR